MDNTVIKVRPGLLERLKENSGITSDEAFARTIGVSRQTLIATRNGEREPSIGFAVGVAQAFGLGLSEVVVWEDEQKTEAPAA
ncbi:helix-turn-helix transcriptional regulator [Corynebacterium jeddahense]|uniref:Helix-turn-helix protein n=1 Tax=Corynebacterium jeddahense TaxID=1414719 RepID=A0ABY7UHT5_9CORY|nr:helix-turn-helix domain-containing protein [Corynebacterium jeddahense]WCZ37828.1 Helix-turn-helix protein [Corynebacterium jeddahense]